MRFNSLPVNISNHRNRITVRIIQNYRVHTKHNQLTRSFNESITVPTTYTYNYLTVLTTTVPIFPDFLCFSFFKDRITLLFELFFFLGLGGKNQKCLTVNLK